MILMLIAYQHVYCFSIQFGEFCYLLRIIANGFAGLLLGAELYLTFVRIFGGKAFICAIICFHKNGDWLIHFSAQNFALNWGYVAKLGLRGLVFYGECGRCFEHAGLFALWEV